MFTPFNYPELNLNYGTYTPSSEIVDSSAYRYWQRSLYQRALSIIKFENLPESWTGRNKNYFNYCIFILGFVGVFNSEEYGLSFQDGSLYGQNFYYQPTNFLIANPVMKDIKKDFKIGEECELIRLTEDYCGTVDIINYYAEKLANISAGIDMSIINSKLAWILGAKNKATAETLKKAYQEIQSGKPCVILDQAIPDDQTSKETPFQFLERGALKQSYITTDLLIDLQTLIQNFDAEIGIPTLPYQKKERINTKETQMRSLDGTSRSKTWLENLTESIEDVNKMFGTNIKVSLTYDEEEVYTDGNIDTDGSGEVHESE